MKKLRFAFVLLLCLGVFLCLCSSAYAEPAVIDSGTCGADGDNLTWTLYDTGELVIDGTGAMADYDYAPWYYYREKIESVTIHDGVTSIGDYAFYGCSSLASVTIPESVTSIGWYAYSGCSGLTSVTIPEGVTSIGWYTFSGCSNLTSVTIPEGVTSIGSYAFQNCSSLTSVTIPKGVTSIGDAAFIDCTALADVYYGGSETKWESINIGYFNDPLTNATIHCALIDSGICGANLTWTLYNTGELVIDGTGRMADYKNIIAPWYKNRLKISAVTIHDGVTSIGVGSFTWCDSLTSVTIPESVTSIGSDAFSYCCSLTILTIPKGVTSIGVGSFTWCDSLTSVTIPEGVTSIGDGAFSDCFNLTSVTIPEGVTNIGGYTFAGCSSLTNVTIPESVTSIGDEAFSCCSSLTSVTIPEGVTSIGNSAFQFCSSLTSVTIPEGVMSIGESVFSECSGLTSVMIPKSVTSIGEYAFERCIALADVYYGGSESQWKSISIENYNEPLTNATIHYHSVRPNPDFILPSSLMRIESEAFTGGAFTYVYIPETVERIDGGAFASCPKLACAQFAGADTVIDGSAFSGVTGLTIIAPGGSTAETFAAAHGFDFMPAA